MKDNILNIPYEYFETSAQDVSQTLFNVYSKLGIDIKSFFGKIEIPKSTPKEIYEYQNFFLLKDGDDLFLLDGFRRLLVFDVPDVTINCRVYNRALLSDKQLLQLLVNLNHTKFFGGLGAYYERGFALALKTFFGVDILAVKDAMDGFLSYTRPSWNKDGYNIDKYKRDQQAEEIVKRIVSDNFIPTCQFLENCQKNNILTITKIGFLLHERGKTYDFEKFLELVNKTDAHAKLHLKWDNAKDSRVHEYANQLIQIYTNIFDTLDKGSEEVDCEFYEDKVAKCKTFVADFKKDKSFTILTNKTFVYKEEQDLCKAIQEGKTIQWQCVVFPQKENFSNYSFGNIIGQKCLDYGINSKVSFKEFQKNHLSNCFIPIFEVDGISINRPYGYYRNSSPRLYVELQNMQKIFLAFKIIE